MKKNKIFVIIFSIIILIFSFVISLCLGAEKIDFSLLLKDFLNNSQNLELNFQKIILFNERTEDIGIGEICFYENDTENGKYARQHRKGCQNHSRKPF